MLEEVSSAGAWGPVHTLTLGTVNNLAMNTSNAVPVGYAMFLLHCEDENKTNSFRTAFSL
jgi:hypothetical protein